LVRKQGAKEEKGEILKQGKFFCGSACQAI